MGSGGGVHVRDRRNRDRDNRRLWGDLRRSRPSRKEESEWTMIAAATSTLNSANLAMKLSVKGFEQSSERALGRYTGTKTGRKMPLGCLMRPRPGHLRDFSESFLTEFSEVHMQDATAGGSRR